MFALAQGGHRGARRRSRGGWTRAPGPPWSGAMVQAGGAPNVIPSDGDPRRDPPRARRPRRGSGAGSLVEDLVHTVVAPYAVQADVVHIRGVPPVVNTRAADRRPAPLRPRRSRPGRRADRAVHGRRGLRVVPAAGARARWAGWAPARRAGRPTTCTRATWSSTSRACGREHGSSPGRSSRGATGPSGASDESVTLCPAPRSGRRQRHSVAV